MTTRKVQVTGGNTYIVSLPKNWIKEGNIVQGDSLRMVPQKNGELLISPVAEKSRKGAKKVIIVNEEDGAEDILQRLLASYISGASSIILKAKTRFNHKQKNAIRKFTRQGIGIEIVNESRDSVTVQDLLESSKISMSENITRMQNVVYSMYLDAIESLEQNDPELAMDMMARLSDVQRLFHLVRKQFNERMQNPGLYNVTEGLVTSYYRHAIAMSISESAHLTHEIGQIIQNRSDSLPEGKNKTLIKLINMGKNALNMRDVDVIKENGLDSKALNTTMEKMGKVEEMSRELLENSEDLNPGERVTLGLLHRAVYNFAKEGNKMCQLALERNIIEGKNEGQKMQD